MARFIECGTSYLNLDTVEEFYREDNHWFARLRGGDRKMLGPDNEYREHTVEIASGPIVPAAADQTVHYFWLNNKSELGHYQSRVIAWVLRAGDPLPITTDGPLALGEDPHSKTLVAVRRPDGSYGQGSSDLVFADEEAIRRMLLDNCDRQ